MRGVFSLLFVLGHVKCNDEDEELAYQTLTRNCPRIAFFSCKKMQFAFNFFENKKICQYSGNIFEICHPKMSDCYRFGSLSDLDHCRFWIISGFGSFLGKCSKSINDPNATMIQIDHFHKCFSIWNIISQKDRFGSFFWKMIDLDHFFWKLSIWIISWGNFDRNDPNRSFSKIMIQIDLLAK